MPRRSPLALLLLPGLACVTACDRPAPPTPEAPAASATPHSAPARRPQPLVVSIVVDQEAAWIADERWPLLPADGGFARLRHEGTYAREMRYAHAVTDTAPGHAALYTGAPPRVNGVWANEVWDATTRGKVSILRDPGTTLVAAEATKAAGSSAAVLKGDTVADRFEAAHGDALVVSISLKDRGAIFGGGRRPTATIWYDKELDRFVTSSAFASAFPAWAQPLAAAREVRARPWTLLDPGWVASHAATGDVQAGEGELGGAPAMFPHDVAGARAPAAAFRGSPWADDAIFGLALAAIDGEKAASRPSLVALSLSANDYVGHAFGPDSWEAWDELRRLDASLGRFFLALDQRLGTSGWAAILSADHGVTTMPEATAVARTRPWCTPAARGAARDAGGDRWERACGKVGRLLPDDLTTELRAVATKTIPGDAMLVTAVADPYVYFSTEARALPAADLARLKKALTAALLRHPEVDRVLDTSALPETCPAESDESMDALVCRSYVPVSAGDLYVVPKPGSFFDPGVVVGKGTSHGSPYLFDRAVPLLVRAPGRAEAGRIVDAPISFRAFARTLSTLLDVEPPNPEATRAPDLARAP